MAASPVRWRQGDQLERQACDLAARIVRGETGLGLRVSKTSAAHEVDGRSPGFPVPATLRAQMENSLGADLSAVRMHTDATASAMARSGRAEAFTSGADIFFRSDRYAPGSETGRRLIAHELVHVLQQTGRFGPSGRLRATRLTGSGYVQCKGNDLVDWAEKYELFDETLSWDDIKLAYAAVSDVDAHRKVIESLLPTTLPASPATLKALTALTTTTTFKQATNEQKGLYVDALKLVGAHEAAATVLISNPGIPTSFRSRIVYEHVIKQPLDWIAPLAASDAFTKSYYPDRLANVYGEFFLTPGQDSLDLEPVGKSAPKTFGQKITAELSALKRARGLVNNELRATMLLAFYYLDDARRKSLSSTLRARIGPKNNLVEIHRDLAEQFARGFLQQLAPMHLPECEALFALVLPKIQAHAVAAAKFWNRTLEFQKAVQAGGSFRDLTTAEVRSIVDGMKTDKRFGSLSGTFLAVAKQLLVRPGGRMMAQPTFATRHAQQRTILQQAMTDYSAKLFQLVRTGNDSSSDGLRFGLTVISLARIEQVLALYDPVKDAAFSKGKLGDVRMAARVRLARALLNIAIAFGWDELRSTANDVFQEGLQIALLGLWKQDRELPFGELSRQAGGGLQTLQGTKITGAMLDRYAYIAYLEELADRLTELLASRGKTFSGKTPILTEAIDAAKKSTEKPRRFIVEDWEVGDPSMVQAGAKGPSAKPSDFGKAVFDHPVTVALLKSDLVKGETPSLILAPAELIKPPLPLYLWIVPRLDAFAVMISNLPLVQQAVDAYWKATKKGTPPDPAAEPLAWLLLLGEATTALSAAKSQIKDAMVDALAAEISGAVESDFTRAEKGAKAKAREAVSHERRSLVEAKLWPLLQEQAGKDIRKWLTPDNVLIIVSRFLSLVWPKEDQDLQLSAMILEIAREADAAFGEAVNYDAIDAFLTLSWGAVIEWEARPAAISDISWMTREELDERAAILRQLRNRLFVRAESEQRRRGINGKKGDQLSSVYWDTEGWALIKWNMAFTAFKKGQPFMLHGDTYLIVEVFEDFTYHPAFGREMVGWNRPGKKPAGAKLLNAAGVEIALTGRKLFTLLHTPRTGDAEVIHITDTDETKLTWISGILSETMSFEYIRGAGVFIDRYANVIMDVLELIPGMGQGLATARFIGSILQTIGSAEFRDVLKAFSEDGFGAFETIFESFGAVVDPVELAQTLIFESDFTEKTRNHPRLRGKGERQRTIEGRGGSWIRIGRLLKNVVEIGVRVLDRIKRVTHRVQTPYHDAQLWVLHHPVAGMLLELVDRGFAQLSSLSVEDLAESAEDLLDKGWEQFIKEATTNAAQGVADRGRDTLDALRHLELPEEVIPVEWIIDFLIDLAVRALSAKYRKGVQAVRHLLVSVGLWDNVLNTIKEALFTAGVDPNELYREHARKKLQPWFESVRDSFAGEITDVLQSVPFVSTLTKPKGQPISLDFSGLGFPEAEAYGSAPGSSLAHGARAPNAALPTEGPRLPHRQRAQAEGSLGHDLRHVRLHRDARADTITRGFAADAITSGSHVFMRSGLDVNEPRGRHILHHELAHVVQQTGARPLGKPFSDQPAAGTPGRGLRWEPAREAAAERAANSAASGNIAPAPMAVGGQADGIQPAFTAEFLHEFLHRLQTGEDLEKARDRLLKTRKSVVLDAESQAVASALGPALKSWIAKKSTFETPFSTVHAELKTFADAVWPEFETTIPLLVAHAITTMSPPKKSGVETGTVAYLPPESLKVQLERELYALTSMGFVIDLHAMRGPKTIKERTVVDPKKLIKSVKVIYVHLPFLKPSPASEKLWDLLVENTFKNTKGYTAASHGSFRAAAQLVLGRSGHPNPDTYDKAVFKLSFRRATVVRNQRGRLTGFVDPTTAWPTVKQYTDKATGNTPTGVRDIGLRLGTYATPVAGGSVSGDRDRDAHHTVQYLLFEYFRNAKVRKPFPLLGKQSYPGVDPTGAQVKALKLKDSRIDVETYFPARGGAMTTLYLSRHAHQSGIHYRTEQADDGPTPRPTQGGAIDNTFKTFLGDYAPVMKDPATLAELESNRQAKDPDKLVGNTKTPLSVNRLNKAIFTAAQKTYADMWGDMKPKLKRALQVQELDYYNVIAKLRGLPELQRGDMAEIYKTVVAETEAEIGGKAGFAGSAKP